MRIAYLDCATGIAGDMTLAALIDAGVDPQAIRRGIDSLGLKGVKVKIESVMRCGFRATHVKIEHPEQHAHRHLSDIIELIDGASELTDSQRTIAKSIFEAVAAAEAKVHGSTVDEIHFHEVGAIDSIVDIVGVAIGFDLLKVDRILAGRVPTGRGTVQIAHGACPVPTPGTAELLKGIPLIDVPIEAELTTPTGAAILKVMVEDFEPIPPMTIDTIGYGAGTRDFPGRANVLRLLVGDGQVPEETDQVALLETNLDDVSGEVIGYAKQRLLAEGALDVFTTAIQMKKERPGVLLSVLCEPSRVAEFETIIFQETGTFGIRRQRLDRSIRRREELVLDSEEWGPVKGKLGYREGEAVAFKPEFEACAKIAREQQIPLRDVYRALEAWFESEAEHSHDHDHGDCDDDCGHDHDHDHRHDHDHGRQHDHDHDHRHDHDHDHRHDHDHDHSHDHHHDH